MKLGQLLLIALIGNSQVLGFLHLSNNNKFSGKLLGFVVELNKDIKETKGKAYTRYNDEFLLPKFSLTICLKLFGIELFTTFFTLHS